MKTKIYYSTQNGGDGSAYPYFMESEALAVWDQDHMSEGWGESCHGSLEVESEGLVTSTEIITAFGYLIENQWYGDMDDREEFLRKFFPDGMPEFTVEKEECKNSRGYADYTIKVDGKFVAEKFNKNISCEKFSKKVKECFIINNKEDK